MKTLLIDARTGGDWGQDLLFAGHVRKFGPENVIDYPFHTKHREKFEYTGKPDHDWGLERRTLGYTPDNEKVRAWGSEEIYEMIKTHEIGRIFLDERDESYELFLKLKANFFDIPVVIVAGHDRLWQNYGVPGLIGRFGSQLEALFLDNWRPEYAKYPKTHVYNWSINFDHYWDPRKRYAKEDVYDISFMGYNSHQDRAKIVDHIQKKWGHLRLKLDLERTPDTMRSYVRKSDYFEVMAKSKICLNLRGAAENGKTLRFYEIPYVGSHMLSQDSGAVQVRPFEDGVHCSYFKELDELDRKIELLLGDDDYRRAVARVGHLHAMTNHTVDARMEQMYEVLGG